MTKLGLGTVQFGIPYGISGSQRLMELSEVQAIVAKAINDDIRYFDTAPSYGVSEQRLGEALIEQASHLQLEVATKISAVDRQIWKNEKKYLDFVSASMESSRKNLGNRTKLAVLFHDCEIEFLESVGWKAAVSLLAEKFELETIGVSVYDLNQAQCAIQNHHIRCLQIPANLLDRRFLDKDFLLDVKRKNIQLVARSVFLQGILCAPAHLNPVNSSDKLENLINLLRRNYRSERLIKKAALKFIFDENRDVFDYAILGVQTVTELSEIFELLEEIAVEPGEDSTPGLAEILNYSKRYELHDPRKWH